MKDICVPIPDLSEKEIAEIKIKIEKKRTKLNYRVITFPWEVDSDFEKFEDELSLSLLRIERLKKTIKSYDEKWELIQIFNPSEKTKNIQVLYRKK